jgi:hypothetical protein
MNKKISKKLSYNKKGSRGREGREEERQDGREREGVEGREDEVS